MLAAEIKHLFEVAPRFTNARAVGLVDDKDIGNLEQSGLVGLHRIAPAGIGHHDRRVRRRGNVDLHLPDGDALELLREGAFSENTGVVVMTAFGGVKEAVEAMRMGAGDYLSVSVLGLQMAAARSQSVVLSLDAGLTWKLMPIPTMLTGIHCVLFAPDGTLWLGAREGVYFTHDLGKTWLWIERIPFRDADDLSYDAASGRILASSRSSDQIYSIDPRTMTWKWWQTGYRISLVRATGDRMVVASPYDGVLVEPGSSPARLAQK